MGAEDALQAHEAKEPLKVKAQEAHVTLVGSGNSENYRILKAPPQGHINRYYLLGTVKLISELQGWSFNELSPQCCSFEAPIFQEEAPINTL